MTVSEESEKDRQSPGSKVKVSTTALQQHNYGQNDNNVSDNKREASLESEKVGL